MPRLARIAVGLLAVWAGGGVCRTAFAAEEFAYFHENVMGTSLELRVTADNARAGAWAERQVLREIDRLTRIFSGYEASSEFSRWQATRNQPTKLAPELFEILRASDVWRERSGGAFDPRVEALSRLWSRCASLDRLPTDDEQAAALALMREPAWRLDLQSHTAERLSACPLTLNAIAKGDIVERACAAALDERQGVHGLLLNVGGDMRIAGATPRRIGLIPPNADSESTEPFTTIEVRNRAVATSGRSQRGFRIQGRWYSHVFDPRTGLPAAGVASATVIADRSADADALGTIFNVLAPEESMKLAESLPGVEALIVTTDGRVVQSRGWHTYERPQPVAVALDDRKSGVPAKGKSATPLDGTWNRDYEMVINFEINQPSAAGRRYRRPYVAVWVEDKKGFPVRCLALWVSFGGPGPFQWLPDLKRWYKSDRDRRLVEKTDMIDAIARPTRPPGKYSVIWDGKDNNGKLLDRGEYIVYVEAAREHGTYQSIRKSVTVGDTPFTEELKGNVEIKSASIQYRRKPAAK